MVEKGGPKKEKYNRLFSAGCLFPFSLRRHCRSTGIAGLQVVLWPCSRLMNEGLCVTRVHTPTGEWPVDLR